MPFKLALYLNYAYGYLMHLSNLNIAMKTVTRITISPKEYYRYVSLLRAYVLIVFTFLLVALVLSLW
jgi:hypothetical protein